jgi:hypothetical protein
MKRWLILLLALTVSACAVEPIQLPDFEAAERQDVEVTDPVEYTQLCEWPWTTAECLQRLDVFEDEAIDNKDLAQINANIARDSDEAYDHILAAAKAQQEISQIRQEMLEAERRDHFWDNVWLKSLIVLLGLGYAL